MELLRIVTHVVYSESGCFGRAPKPASTHEQVIEVASDDTDINQYQSQPAVLPNDRRRDVLDVAYRRVELVHESLRQHGICLDQDGTSLAEASSVMTALRLARPLHRRVLLHVMRERWHPTRMTWVLAADAEVSRKEARLFVAAARSLGIELWLRRTAPRGSVVQAAVNAAYVKFDRARALGRGYLRRSAVQLEQANARVVFPHFFLSNLAAVKPLAEAAAKLPGVEVRWLAGRPAAAEALKKAGIASLPLEAFDPPFVVRRRLHHAWTERAILRALDGLSAPALGEPPETSGALLNYTRQILRSALVPSLRDAVWLAAMWTAAIRELRPVALVSSNHSNVFDRCAALASRQLGATAVFVQHGLLAPMLVNGTYCHDLLLVWGELDKRTLSACGADARLIRPVGSPRHHHYPPRPVEGKPRVLFFASRTGGVVVDEHGAVNAIASVGRSTERLGAFLTVKVHPSDHTDVAERTLAGLKHAQVIRGGSAAELAAGHDVVVVMSSTTAYDACLASRPLIIYGRSDAGLEACLELGAALAAPDEDALLAALRASCFDLAVRERLVQGCTRFANLAMAGTGEEATQNACDALRQALRSVDHTNAEANKSICGRMSTW